MSLSSASIHLLNTSRDGASTTSLGSLTALCLPQGFELQLQDQQWDHLRAAHFGAKPSSHLEVEENSLEIFVSEQGDLHFLCLYMLWLLNPRGGSIHVHGGPGDETSASRELAPGSYWQEHSLAIAN